MNEKEKQCVRALRICHSNEDCRDCEFMESDRNEKSCVNILFEDAADIIESLSDKLEAAQPKWISVEDELPPVGEKVLVCANNVRVMAFIDCEDVWHRDTITFRLPGAVTHWMPLPEPPKEET